MLAGFALGQGGEVSDRPPPPFPQAQVKNIVEEHSAGGGKVIMKRIDFFCNPYRSVTYCSGRKDAKGVAISLVTDADVRQVERIEDFLRARLQDIFPSRSRERRPRSSDRGGGGRGGGGRGGSSRGGSWRLRGGGSRGGRSGSSRGRR
jgi:uncharacterized membrane protein YgcG